MINVSIGTESCGGPEGISQSSVASVSRVVMENQPSQTGNLRAPKALIPR